MPFTAGSMVVAWLAITGIPPFAGFWAEGRDHRVGVRGRRLRALGARDRRRRDHRHLHDAPDLPDVLRQRALPRHRGSCPSRSSPAARTTMSQSTERGRGPVGASDRPRSATTPTSPTVQYGEPPRETRLHGHDPHESPILMVVPILALAVLSFFGGLLNLPFKGLEFLDEWLEPSSKGWTSRIRRRSSKGSRSRCRGALRGRRHRARVPALPTRPSHPGRDPLQREARARRAALWATRTTTTPGSRPPCRGPVAATSPFLDRVVDQKVIDGAVNGVGRSCRPRLAGSATCRTGTCGATRSGSPSAPRPCSSSCSAYAGADRGLPDPLRHHRDAAHRRGHGHAACRRAPRDREGRRLRVDRDHVRLRGLDAVALRPRATRSSSSSSSESWIPKLGVSYLVGVDGITLFMVVVTARARSRSACSPRRATSSTG